MKTKSRAERRRADKKNKPTHAQRRALCAEYGIKNTGRQWKRLRSRLRLTVRYAMENRRAAEKR